ncbi:MAG TPA: VWA domain-containing protein [Candidatus Eisenbacteria bacterium]|nr:VWA domain-containing protein [Candidatus Eisenbacteria bacterium]
MTFQQPAFLAGLLLVPALAALYVLAQRRRRRFTVRFTNLALLQSVVSSRPGHRRHVPPALLMLGAAGLLLAMAGPVLNLEVARSNASVMLVVDVSGSMQATDVTPTRLEAARSAARTLIDQLPGNARVGLVSFNGSATLSSPLTDDRDQVRAALDGLQAGGGTAIGDGLSLAVQQLAPNAQAASPARRAPALIVLLTDGVSNAGSDPLSAADRARAAGIPVATVGIGQRNASVRVRGQEVGGVDEQTLQAIAGATGGKYYYAEASAQLQQIYSSLGSQFGWEFVRWDATVPMVVLGTAAVLAAAGLSLWWFRLLP